MSSIRNFRVADRNILEFLTDGSGWIDGQSIDEKSIQRYFEKFLSQKDILKFQLEFGETFDQCVFKVHTEG